MLSHTTQFQKAFIHISNKINQQSKLLMITPNAAIVEFYWGCPT